MLNTMLNTLYSRVFHFRTVLQTGIRSIGQSSHKSLSQLLLKINKSKDIKDLLRILSHYLDDICDCELAGFTVSSGESQELWMQSTLRGSFFPEMVRKDLGRQKNDEEIHTLDPLVDSIGQCSDFIRIRPEHIVCHPISNQEYSARVYFIPRKKRSRRRAKLLDIVLAGFTIALDNLLYIEKLEHAATMDPLTRCYNRRALNEYLERDIAFARRHGGELSVIMLDIDDFKRINDAHGHQSGDEVLRELSAVVSSMVRKSDYLSRFGGEEFVLVLPRTALKHAVHLAEKIRRKIAGHRIQNAGRPLSITSSFGVACYRNGLDSLALLQKADEMLYHAKASGKNVVMPCAPLQHPAHRKTPPLPLSESAGKKFPPELVPRLSQG